MNTFERKVGDLLRSYGEGLDMTTQDVNRLEEGLEQKRAGAQSASRKRRNRIFQGAVAACAVTGVVLGALALRDGSEPAPQPVGPSSQIVASAPLDLSLLAGMWREEPQPGDEPNGWVWTFSSRGLAIDGQPDRVLRLRLQPTHTLRMAAGGFTVTDVDAPACSTTFATSISPEGRMRATVTTSTPTQGRLCSLTKGQHLDFTRVSPASAAGAAASSVWPARTPSPVTGVGDLSGTWLLKGTGRVLTITGTGEYEIQDLGAASVQRRGTVTVASDGQVTFTAADDPSCTAVYRPITSTYNAFDAVLSGGVCARLGRAGDQWIRLN